LHVWGFLLFSKVFSS